MKLEIDLDKDNPEDLKTIAQIIQRRFPAVREDIISKSYTQNERVILAILDDLTQKMGNVVPMDDIYEAAKGLNLKKKQIEDAITYQKKRGNVFEPRSGFIQKI